MIETFQLNKVTRVIYLTRVFAQMRFTAKFTRVNTLLGRKVPKLNFFAFAGL